MSRNGTILDDERLQSGQRHALRVGQTLGLGESGPRFRVSALDARLVSETVMEMPDVASSPKTTAPRQRAALGGLPTGAGVEGTAAMRKSEALRAGVKFEEPTEPTSPAPDWLVHVVLYAPQFDQRAEARSRVVKIGRSPECTVRVAPEQGASVSRIHAEIAINGSGVVVRDAGSRNGTFLNSLRIESAHPVVKGDQIMLGSGGPAFIIEDLRIVKEGAIKPRTGSSGIGGSATPDDLLAAGRKREPFIEPPTMPSPHGADDGFAIAGTRLGTKPASALRAPKLEDGIDEGPGRNRRLRLFLWLGMALLVIAAAVAIGRLTAS
jgi:pSer/pThr/pTyr-binding forkhead associated (FHA) protein